VLKTEEDILPTEFSLKEEEKERRRRRK